MPEHQPYEIVPPPPLGRDPEQWRRYSPSRRLAQFAHELEVWERAGLIAHPRYVDKARYRREALERWEEFLDGWTPERTKAHDPGRPPKLKG